MLLSTRGYNGFSYRDLAKLVGIKTSSIHYYFPAKEDLALVAVQTYATNVDELMGAIAINAPLKEQIDKYLALWRTNLSIGRVCLCGKLVAESARLAGKRAGGIANFLPHARNLDHATPRAGYC